LLAEAYSCAGQPEAGLTVLDEAVTLMATTEARWWEAEVYRLKGEILLASASTPADTRHTWAEAEPCFHQALTVARGQQARALELRAALSLSRLWLQQKKREEVRQLLAPIYGWFTEGFDTADLREARALLEQMELGDSTGSRHPR
jgi:predicted ATPase